MKSRVISMLLIVALLTSSINVFLPSFTLEANATAAKISTNLELVERALDVANNYKTLYVMGGWGQPLTAANKEKLINAWSYNQQPERAAMINAASSDTFAFDCVCLIKGLLWGWDGTLSHTNGGANYGSNGVSDVDATGMINYCYDISTDFSNIEVGELLWMPDHVGLYIGDGLAVECTPAWKNCVQITAYNAQAWTKHGKLQYVEYVSPCEHTYKGEGVCSKCGYRFPWESTKDTSYAGTYTVTLSGGTYPRLSAPYSDAAKSSTLFPKGVKISVSYGVTNAYENLWYYATYNGVSGFVNSDNVTLDSRPTQQFTCLISSPAEGAIVPKSAYPVIGTLTSAYYQIKEVKAYIDGSCYATVSNVNATSLELRPTAINQNLNFAALSTGKHVLRIDARDSQSSSFVTVINRTFYTETTEHSCDKGEFAFYEAAHPHRNCYKCSICGETWRDTTSTNKLSSCDACSMPKPIYVTPGIYTIHSARDNNYVLDIQYDSTDNCANIQLYRNLNNEVQKFRVVEYGDYYLIQSVYSGFWLDVAYPYFESRSNVQLFNSYENNEEKWLFEDAGNGYVYIRNYYGNFLDIAGDAAVDNANVQVYDTKESDSQRWKLNLLVDESHTHQYSYRTTTEPTCTTDGVKTYTCNCGDSYTEVVPAYGHNWCAWETKKSPTCTQPGSRERLCQWCYVRETESIPATGHAYGSVKYEYAHPHKAYKECTTCGSIAYTGSFGSQDGCADCYPATASGTCGDNLTWAYYSGMQKLVICGSGAMCDYSCQMGYCSSPWAPYVRNINQVELPEGMTSIGKWAFYCIAATSITIPSTVNSVAATAFTGSRIENFYVSSENPYLDDVEGVLYSKDHKSLIAYPNARTDPSYAILPGTVLIEACVFLYNDDLKEITIPQSVREIGAEAFSDSNITEISIPEGVTVIENDTFKQCVYLKKVKLPSTLKQIKKAAFNRCLSLSEINIPEQVESLGWLAFSECTGLTELVFPASLKTIDDDAFENCTNLSNVYFWGDAPKIGSGVFQTSDNTNIPGLVLWYIEGRSGWAQPTWNGYPTKIWGNVAHQHEYTPLTTPPTCTEKGYTTYICTCGDSYTDTYVPAIGHAWDSGTVIKEPTETDPGEKLLSCTRCTETKTESIPALGHTHSYNSTTVTPTCTEQGYTVYTCNCGDSYTSDYTAALGHSYSNGVCVSCGAEAPAIGFENPFVDVKESDYFCTPVLWAVRNGITNGTSLTTFSPNAPCTRGQIVTFLWRACGSPEPTSAQNPFTDVKSGEYYYKAVLWAVEEGITTGISATEFGPNATCTRGQVATFLWRAQGKPAPTNSSNPFSDVKASDYYYEAVLWAVENNITNGTGVGKFSPNDSCTRGQIVTFLYRTLN